jgi:hypothetical protein
MLLLKPLGLPCDLTALCLTVADKLLIIEHDFIYTETDQKMDKCENARDRFLVA